jgi:hypothetical protein
MPLVAVISNLLRFFRSILYFYSVLARLIITKAPTSGINEYAPLFPVMVNYGMLGLGLDDYFGNGYQIPGFKYFSGVWRTVIDGCSAVMYPVSVFSGKNASMPAA